MVYSLKKESLIPASGSSLYSIHIYNWFTKLLFPHLPYYQYPKEVKTTRQYPIIREQISHLFSKKEKLCLQHHSLFQSHAGGTSGSNN